MTLISFVHFQGGTPRLDEGVGGSSQEKHPLQAWRVAPAPGLPQSRANVGSSSRTYGGRLEEPRFHRQTLHARIRCQQNFDGFIYFAVALAPAQVETKKYERLWRN
jgi:hypothetical protein